MPALFYRLRQALRSEPWSYELKPVHDVLERPERKLNWEALGSRPTLELKIDTHWPQQRWLQLRFAFQTAESSRPPTLFFDRGEGFLEEESLTLPRPLNGFVQASFQLPKGVQGLRLRPLDRPGSFQLAELELRSVGKVVLSVEASLPYVQRLAREPRRLPAVLKRYWGMVRKGGFSALRGDLERKASPPSSTTRYEDWVRLYGTLNAQDRKQIAERISHLQHRPLLSVLMPTYNPPLDLLKKAIESVQRQIYPNWELCIADDASTDPQVVALLQRFAAADSRIRVLVRPENGHISAASNTALEFCQGEFVALLDHDDELSEHALYYVAEELNRHPDVDLIYSDEDKIDAAGHRFDPYFKSDWDPELFRSQNFLNHLTVYRTERIREVGGFRLGFEGSQDYDVALRVTERIPPSRIRHIPAVLYHWRAIPGSTALSSDHKSYAFDSAQRALQEHLDRVAPGSRALPSPAPGYQRAQPPMPQTLPLVSLIIPTKDGLDLLRQCIDSIRARTEQVPYEILVVNNRSERRETLAYFAQLETAGVQVLSYDLPFNYSAINNLGARHAKGEVLVLLNNDVEVINPDWLVELVRHAMRPEVGAVGARLLYPDGSVQHAGVTLGIGAVAGHTGKHVPRNEGGYFNWPRLTRGASAVTAACLAVRKASYDAVGGLEERLEVTFNDVDFCLRLGQRGLRHVYTPHAELFHYESATRGPEDSEAKRQRFTREVQFMQHRWGAVLQQDPFYNPNLSDQAEDFSLACPPRTMPPWHT